MKPYLADPDVTLYHGSAIDVLAELPTRAVQTVITSPPYWGLRDYGADGQIGLEQSPDAYVAAMVSVFREVHRVLRDDGTCWLNLGDSYADGKTGRGDAGREGEDGFNGGGAVAQFVAQRKPPEGLKPKDLVGIPWRVAFALQADGWYLRSDIIWSKPNPMPESVTDRPTKAHEYVFLLSKSPRYFYDADAIREDFQARPQQRLTRLAEQPLADARRAAGVDQGEVQGGAHRNPYAVQTETLDESLPPEAPRGADGRRQTIHREPATANSHANYSSKYGGERWPGTGRNARSVWEITTQPTPEAHFATYPEALVRRCILAGTSEAGECSACGAPYQRQTAGGESTYVERKALGYDQPANMRPGEFVGHHNGIHPPGMSHDLDPKPRVTTGWAPTCTCGAPPRPQTVLDPFIGSGTTAKVARDHNRRAIGIDLNADYLAIAARRLSQQSLFA